VSYSPFLLPIMRKVQEGALSVLTLWTVGAPEALSCGTFSGKGRKEFIGLWGNLIKKTFYIYGITFLIQGAKNCCLSCASVPESL